MQTYDVTVRFNSRKKGSGQSRTEVVSAPDINKAIDEVTYNAVRDSEHGHSIYVTGATVDEVKS